MYEKISEIPIREEKIRKLKEKILSEIDVHLNQNRQCMKIYLNNEENKYSKEYWELLITNEFSLLRLRDYIQDKYSFCGFIISYEKEDIIIYKISDRTLNIWLQEEYDFDSNFLYKIEDNEKCNNVFFMLNDDYFGHHFTECYDEIQYDNKMKNSN